MLIFFDKLEDSIRGTFSKYPITYSIVGGIGVVLFWRAVWDTADMLASLHPMLGLLFYPPVQLIISIVILLSTGLMVSVFIGDRIILSGLRHEKKLEERTKELMKEDVVTLAHLQTQIQKLEQAIQDLSEKSRK